MRLNFSFQEGIIKRKASPVIQRDAMRPRTHKAVEEETSQTPMGMAKAERWIAFLLTSFNYSP